MPISAEPSGNFGNWLSSFFHSKTQSGNLLLWMLRGCFGVIIIGAATYALTNLRSEREAAYAILAFFIILGIGFLIVLTDMLVRNKQITSISAIYFGLLLGLFLGWLFSIALEPFVEGVWKDERRQGVRLLVTVICCYICISTLLQ